MRQHRSGFTLIETIVALVLLQIAMLALAATAALAARDFSDALRRRHAFATARAHIGWIRSNACTSPTVGSRRIGAGMDEHWRVDESGRAREVTDSVSVALTRGRRTAAVVRTSVLCGD